MPKIERIHSDNLHPAYLVQGLPLPTRCQKDNENIWDDDWKFIDCGNSLVAVFSTADGQDFEQVEIDLGEELQPGDSLYERVGFTRRYVSKVLEARIEYEADDAAEYDVEDEAPAPRM